jgi:hypothetical protein
MTRAAAKLAHDTGNAGQFQVILWRLLVHASHKPIRK